MTHEKSDATLPQPGGDVGAAQLKIGTWTLESPDGVPVGWVWVEGGAGNTSVEHWFYDKGSLPEGKSVRLTFSNPLEFEFVKKKAKEKGFYYVEAICSAPRLA